MLLGLAVPTSGSVSLMGGAPRQAIERRQVGAMMQTGGLLRDTTVREIITMIAALQDRRDRIDEVLELAQLTKLAGRRVARCSGGEQQRIKFALALISAPDLLLLDEPTAGMDVGARRDFWSWMRTEASGGRTIVFATHYLEEAEDFSQRIVMMGHGQLVADGTTAEVRASALGRRVSATLPTDEESVGAVQDLGARLTVADVSINGSRLSLTTTHSDAVAGYLWELGAHDLVITEPALDDAFVALTQETAQ